MLRGNGSGYVEAEANVLEARFRKLPRGSDSDSGSEAGSGRPMKLPCNVGFEKSLLSNKKSMESFVLSPNLQCSLITLHQCFETRPGPVVEPLNPVTHKKSDFDEDFTMPLKENEVNDGRENQN
ncbi:hypothetical protein YC2023_070478 [Brassica napus]